MPNMVISGMGMMTPVGLNASQSYLSIRAGIERFAETAVYNRHFQPLVMAMLPSGVLPPLANQLDKANGLTSRQERMLRLAAPALLEALSHLPEGDPLPLFLGSPEALYDMPEAVDRSFLENLAAQTGRRFHPTHSQVMRGGRASAFAALKAAVQLLESGEHRHVLVGGVDTFHDLYLLGMLDADDRLLVEGITDGFRPGEGACFLAISNPDGLSDTTGSALASIMGIGLGDEKGHRYSEEPYLGDGLTEAFRHCFQNHDEQNQKIGTIYAGFNGESLPAKEWGVAYLRHASYFEEEPEFWNPCDQFGDTGAALGAIMMGLAASSIHKETVKGPCLIWCSSDYEQRAAVIIDSVNV